MPRRRTGSAVIARAPPARDRCSRDRLGGRPIHGRRRVELREGDRSRRGRGRDARLHDPQLLSRSTVVTKGKMAVYLARALRLKATVTTRFRDVPSSQATGVKKVVAAGIMKGCIATLFCPNTGITRGHMAALLVKALHLTATGSGHFKDVPKSHTFASAIDRLATAGLAITCGSRQLLPGPQAHAGGDSRVPRQGHRANLGHAAASAPGNPGGATIPPEGQLVDTSPPGPRRRHRHAGELHRRSRRGRGRQGRDHHVRLRPRSR